MSDILFDQRRAARQAIEYREMALDKALDIAIAQVTLGISDALGPARPVESTKNIPAKVLLRALKRAIATLEEPHQEYVTAVGSLRDLDVLRTP